MVPEQTALNVVMTVLGGAVTLLGKLSWDQWQTKRGNVSTKEQITTALSERDEIVFQTAMKIAVKGISEAITRGQEATLREMAVMSAAMKDAAQAIKEESGAIREVHEELKAHRLSVAGTMQEVTSSHQLIKDLHKKTMERRRHD